MCNDFLRAVWRSSCAPSFRYRRMYVVGLCVVAHRGELSGAFQRPFEVLAVCPRVTLWRSELRVDYNVAAESPHGYSND